MNATAKAADRDRAKANIDPAACAVGVAAVRMTDVQVAAVALAAIADVAGLTSVEEVAAVREARGVDGLLGWLCELTGEDVDGVLEDVRVVNRDSGKRG